MHRREYSPTHFFFSSRSIYLCKKLRYDYVHTKVHMLPMLIGAKQQLLMQQLSSRINIKAEPRLANQSKNLTS